MCLTVVILISTFTTRMVTRFIEYLQNAASVELFVEGIPVRHVSM